MTDGKIFTTRSAG